MLLENKIPSNINLTLTNVKRYQRYARVVQGSVNANATTSEKIALIACSCDVTRYCDVMIVFVALNNANSISLNASIVCLPTSDTVIIFV